MRECAHPLSKPRSPLGDAFIKKSTHGAEKENARRCNNANERATGVSVCLSLTLICSLVLNNNSGMKMTERENTSNSSAPRTAHLSLAWCCGVAKGL